MVAEAEFFVSDPSGIVGPLSVLALREALRTRVSTEVKVRIAGSSTWLPAFAWEAAGEPTQAITPPPLPAGGPSTVLPPEIAELKPKLRQQLLWFLSDTEGIFGPLSGEFIRQGLASGKIAPTAKLCMVASQEWVRAAVVFPKLIEGPTATRTRPFAVVPCMFCFEAIAAKGQVCTSCGERVIWRKPPGKAQIAAIFVLVQIALVSLMAFGFILVRDRSIDGWRTLRAVSGWVAGPASSAPAAANTASEAALGAAPSDLRVPLAGLGADGLSPPPSGGAPAAGHLAGEVVANPSVFPDVVDVFPLSQDRIAVARKASVDVVDAKSGAIVFTNGELRELRSFSAAGEAIYGLGLRRISVIDPATMRALKWIETGATPGLLTERGGIGLVPLEGESVAVIDMSRHAEIERFRFDERVTSVAVDARGQLGAAATSDVRGPRPGEDAVLLFEPRRLASAQPLRRVYVGVAPVAAAVAPSGSIVAAALLGSSEIARVDLSGGGTAAPRVTRQKSCAEPILVHFLAPSGSLLVGCRAGQAIALHDGASFALTAKVDLGGPVVGLDVSPDGMQALVVIGPPATSVGIVDLVKPSLRRIPGSEEMARARYGHSGTNGVLFSLRTRRALVLK